MYRDPKQWVYVRRLVLEEGGSRRGVSRKTGQQEYRSQNAIPGGPVPQNLEARRPADGWTVCYEV
jgi:hypothetical protein